MLTKSLSILIKLAFLKNHFMNYKWSTVFGFLFPHHLTFPAFISPTSRRLSFWPAEISPSIHVVHTL